MNTQRFMISLKFSQQHRPEIFALLPQEQARAEELRMQGVIEVIYLSADNTVGWLIAHGASQAHVQEALASLPLYSHGYMEANLTLLSQVDSHRDSNSELLLPKQSM